MNRSLLAFPLASLLVALPGCDWLGKLRGDGAPAGAGSASARASASAAPGLPASFAAMQVPAGEAPDGAWLPAYAVGRAAGSDGLTFERAARACRDRGQELCTETQWTRACEVHGALGAVASYTLGAARPGAVVVRGAGGCAARAEVAAASVDPARAALCCTRAVAITSANADESFRAGSAARLLAYERAVRARDAGALRAVLGEQVIFDGRDQPRGEVQAALMGQPAAGAPILDRCEVALDRSGPEPLLVSDCRVLAAGAPALTPLRIVHGGPDTKVLLVGAPEAMPLLDRGKKQRASELIGGD
ncbi:MAG TPA: hypothetical protein PLU22_03250 [Polyangiaceae bacterium]|nr:hypothetical protein [Polyangiaceae bacterium]